MEIGTIASMLWRHRLIALLGAPFIVAIALLGTHRVSLSPLSLSPPQTIVGAATARMLVDTPKSQLVDLDQSQPLSLDGTVADGLAVRVGILADELEGDEWRTSLARAAGISADELDLASSNTGATYTTPLARRLLEINAVPTRRYVVRVTTDGADPIVNVSATAPTAAEATRLTDAAVEAYKQLLAVDSGASGFVARPLGPTRTGLLAQGSGKAMTAALGFVALCAWLVAVIIAGGLTSAWVVRSRVRPSQAVNA